VFYRHDLSLDILNLVMRSASNMPAKRNRKSRDQARLTNSLERRIKDYSLAAVGIGAVVFSPSASAAVVFTTVPHVVPLNSAYTVVLGGHNVLKVINYQNTTDTTSESVSIESANGLKGMGTNRFWGPAQVVRSNQPPVTSGHLIPGGFPVHPGGVLVSSTEGRSFKGFLSGNKFIGFSFGPPGNRNYGWVEFNISQPGGDGNPYSVEVVAAAYETVANQALAAGATTDNSTPPATPAPNSLWLMALGAAGIGGLELLRRRRTA
jgi:MYXO-CTERM domain-containing protein